MCALWRRLSVVWCFPALVCVGTGCVPSVATRVVAKIYRPVYFRVRVRARARARARARVCVRTTHTDLRCRFGLFVHVQKT